MIMKYRDIERIPVPGLPVRGKKYLPSYDVAMLLDGELIIEEKLDGKIESYEREGYIIFAEYLKYVHSVEYTRLPGWFVAFDVWTGTHWLGRSEKEQLLDILCEQCAPLLYRGEIADFSLPLSFLGQTSAYGDGKIEGVVIKNYATGKMGKIIDPDFDKSIDAAGHWRLAPLRRNRLQLI